MESKWNRKQWNRKLAVQNDVQEMTYKNDVHNDEQEMAYKNDVQKDVEEMTYKNDVQNEVQEMTYENDVPKMTYENDVPKMTYENDVPKMTYDTQNDVQYDLHEYDVPILYGSAHFAEKSTAEPYCAAELYTLAEPYTIDELCVTDCEEPDHENITVPGQPLKVRFLEKPISG